MEETHFSDRCQPQPTERTDQTSRASGGEFDRDLLRCGSHTAETRTRGPGPEKPAGIQGRGMQAGAAGCQSFRAHQMTKANRTEQDWNRGFTKYLVCASRTEKPQATPGRLQNDEG